ncbi:hypothetical protein PW52_00100 [Tamlana sedimentorum]|uniref:DUF5017 domain-containing protein n=1 Tax=Neotamlana sedimentorum TaxID=1435349 RepID=A0A0D7WGM6_9FLAO|nr:hypothetical protein [Tamlana sedimentorum]KJD36902.1 hypothetical protein PW52_00100 [Tamlana sedimentorum]
MKKIIYCLTILGAALLVSCDPLEDVNEEVSSGEIAGIDYIKSTGEVYTFTEDDYELYETELDYETYFESQDVADEIIPGFLANKYPLLGQGSLVNVTYNLFSPTDYEVMTTTDTLSNIGYIEDYLFDNFQTSSNGTFVELTYNSEVVGYTFEAGDYETIGQELSALYPGPAANVASYGNFDRRSTSSNYWSDEMILDAMNVVFGDSYSVGQIVTVTFDMYDGSSGTESITGKYNGYEFLDFGSVVEIESQGTAYVFSSSDYDAVVAALGATYPDATGSMASYGNFERRTTNSAYWTDDMILEAINVVLPAGDEGDIYIVSYAIYDGGSGTETVPVAYESGAYVSTEIEVVPTIVENTEIIAKNNNEWALPYTFTDADYELLSQSYGNFDSGSVYKLDIFLKSLYPYAASGDAASVAYEYYSGGTSTKYGTSVFDGVSWTLTPEVLETTFQYGFEDGVWVPDNTIPYTLLNADYEYMASALEDNSDFDGLLGTLVDYHDYDYNWSDDQIVFSLLILAEHLFPNAEEGQKVQFTYLVYDNGLNTLSTVVILTDGVWIEKVD